MIKASLQGEDVKNAEVQDIVEGKACSSFLISVSLLLK